MKKRLVTTLIIISLPFFFASCVSSLLKEKTPSFSKEIKLTAPHSPFIKTETSVYPSWKNKKTGNVISIVSDCNDLSSYKLSELHQLVEASLEDIKILKEETIALQNRPALLRVITARLDGHAIEINSVSFKRKSCGYLASLSGKVNSLTPDKAEFEQFINKLEFE